MGLKFGKTKPIFGKYNPVVDEIIHLLAFPLLALMLCLNKIMIRDFVFSLVFAIVIIDLDHFLNPLIVKILKIDKLPGKNRLEYVTTMIKGEDPFVVNGYNIQIFHGLDVFLFLSFIIFLVTKNIYLTVSLFCVLALHLFWDFLVYPHSWKGLFLVIRIKRKFKLGERKAISGLIFEKDSLLY